MKILKITSNHSQEKADVIKQNLELITQKNLFISKVKTELEPMNIEFYEYIGLILNHIGFRDPLVVRKGDVNCRMDAIIIDNKDSIPIEIKSPGESKEINIKSIRQACENKVVILSRKFYNAYKQTTSLAIAFNYPPERSDVYELIDDIKNAYDLNIGIINIDDLLSLVWDVHNNNNKLNYSYFNTFYGKFNYEKAFIKE